jgi:transposase InsO family protein
MSDNGACDRSAIHAVVCRALGLRHLRTRPYRPRTNGKAERFIRTLLAGWAYGPIYASSTERTAALDAGYGPTTIAAHTAPSATSRPSLASTS